jgi:hypothetical protein
MQGQICIVSGLSLAANLVDLPDLVGLWAYLSLSLKSVLALPQRLATPRTPRLSGTRLGAQPLRLPETPIH